MQREMRKIYEMGGGVGIPTSRHIIFGIKTIDYFDSTWRRPMRLAFGMEKVMEHKQKRCIGSTKRGNTERNDGTTWA